MNLNIKKISLKGHNSFYLRDGWLNKVFMQDDVEFLRNQIEASDILGVGSGMVKSIKYYLSAMGLVDLARKNSPASELFNAIKLYDIYLEHFFTKYILHYNLVSNVDKATTWYTFYNYVNYDEVTKEEVLESIKATYKEALPNSTFSIRSLSDDIDTLIKLYTKKSEKKGTPEDNLESPLADLMLMEFDGKVIRKKTPQMGKLNEYVILYILLSELHKNNISSKNGWYNISLDEIVFAPNNIGKILNLSRIDVYEYIKKLTSRNDIELHETAGLDQLYIREGLTKENVFISYFEEINNV